MRCLKGAVKQPFPGNCRCLHSFLSGTDGFLKFMVGMEFRWNPDSPERLVDGPLAWGESAWTDSASPGNRMRIRGAFFRRFTAFLGGPHFLNSREQARSN